MARLSTEWTAHLQDLEKKKEFEELLFNSRTVLNRLQEILRRKGVSISNTESDLDSYDSPSWSHKQAHLNGERKSLKTILNLITFDRGE